MEILRVGTTVLSWGVFLVTAFQYFDEVRVGTELERCLGGAIDQREISSIGDQEDSHGSRSLLLWAGHHLGEDRRRRGWRRRRRREWCRRRSRGLRRGWRRPTYLCHVLIGRMKLFYRCHGVVSQGTMKGCVPKMVSKIDISALFNEQLWKSKKKVYITENLLVEACKKWFAIDFYLL